MATISSQPKNFQFWNGISTSPNDFNLDAGVFGLSLKATTWGTATLQKLMPDGVTYIPVVTIAANGFQEVHVPAGQYQLALTGVTALVGEIALITHGASRGWR